MQNICPDPQDYYSEEEYEQALAEYERGKETMDSIKALVYGYPGRWIAFAEIPSEEGNGEGAKIEAVGPWPYIANLNLAGSLHKLGYRGALACVESEGFTRFYGVEDRGVIECGHENGLTAATQF